MARARRPRSQRHIKVHSILGGRYVQEEHAGEMMAGHSTGSVSPATTTSKRNTSFGFTTGHEHISEGTADAAGKVFTFVGKMDDPMTGEKDRLSNSSPIVGANKACLKCTSRARADSKIGR
jgi:hypothetical protein